MKKILMIILDGFGLRDDEHGNAVKLSNMEYFNSLWNTYPHSKLEASGKYVGLPEGQFGNSEVCHQVIGLGKKIKQKVTIINEKIDNKEINKNATFNELIDHVNKNQSTLHLMGLLSDGGVHSHINYMKKLIPILKEKDVKKVVFHAITDGRDTYQKSCKKYLKSMDNILREQEIGYVGTICGRFYAMDRDNKWERTKKYYDMVINNYGFNIINYETAINNCYLKGITDEFLPPMILKQDSQIKDNDALLWLNYRPDRARQILTSIANDKFDVFATKKFNNLKCFMMFHQEDVSNVSNLFEMEEANLYPIGEYFKDLNLTQARIAETEKYAHVTTFFNSEKSKQFSGTDNFLIPSPKVSTYDETPIMSAKEVAEKTKECLEKDYDFILVNFANPDMLGHTGNLNATITALKGLDKLLKDVVETADDNFYKVFILADHGNCDEMLTENEEPITTHSIYPVPFIITDKNIELKETGDLTMVAPTLLKYMDIALPKEMEKSKNLIKE